MKIGDKVNILQGCAGTWGNLQQCDSPVTITEKNIDIIESLVRGGIAEIYGGDKSGIEEIVFKGSEPKNENPDILSDSTKTKRGRPRKIITQPEG
jgi:hypothetical protein